ncbi:hypothetical protein D1007_15053 [Hordeum vulgare]|nr:hypothetical protein D1007_15053 [Hordeum vulgare]
MFVLFISFLHHVRPSRLSRFLGRRWLQHRQEDLRQGAAAKLLRLCEELLKFSSTSDARALAQAGVAAASKAATEAATAAKAERDKLTNNKTQWRCMDIRV